MMTTVEGHLIKMHCIQNYTVNSDSVELQLSLPAMPTLSQISLDTIFSTVICYLIKGLVFGLMTADDMVKFVLIFKNTEIAQLFFIKMLSKGIFKTKNFLFAVSLWQILFYSTMFKPNT